MTKKVPQKYIRTAADRQAIAEGCYWDDSHFIQFQKFSKEFCIQTQGDWAGKGIELFDFQIDDIFGPLLSWRKADGTYRFNLGLIFSSKKIGKTTAIAALCAYRATCYKDQQIYVIASKVEQARICFDTIKEFTRHPALQKRWHVKDTRNEIIDRQSGSRIKVLACNPSGISGFSADLFILDETAEMPNHAAQTIWDRIEFAGAAKPNSMTLSITTPAHSTDHLGYRLYQRCQRLIDGTDAEDTATLPVIYGVPVDEDWEDEKNWLKYLPHINKTVPLSFYRTQYKRAKGDMHEELSFRIYLLGQYCRNKNQFFDLTKWSQCAIEMPDLQGMPAVIGLDNGGQNDLLAISILVPYEDSVCVIPKAYLSQEALKRKMKTGQTIYQTWVDQGLIEVTHGDTITFDTVTRLLDQIYEAYDVRALAYDPWHLSELETEFEKKKRLVIETPQYGKYTSPLIMEMERRIAEATISHGNHPVLTYCIENMQVKENSYGKLEYKKDHQRSKIDLAVSTIVALNALPEVDRITPIWTLPPIMSL